ncbi:hypothetical protein [Dipodfec virus RodF1_68]|uniref:Uncharacterized protein n=1 Tax=Dipodfec virus RodF1_68 TaxID=2929308 RepID=A0A976R8W9_9VIRU|nr:hypothetical protein [Dipodfec virus RodF1_68]
MLLKDFLSNSISLDASDLRIDLITYLSASSEMRRSAASHRLITEFCQQYPALASVHTACCVDLVVSFTEPKRMQALQEENKDFTKVQFLEKVIDEMPELVELSLILS